MISSELAAFIAKTERNDGFALKDVPAGTLLKIQTQNETLFVLVADPAEGKVILKASKTQDLKEPNVFFLQGSTGGGSAVKLDWIGVGLHLRMNAGEGGLLRTSPVKSFEVIEDEKLKKELEAARDSFDSAKPISTEEFERVAEEIISKSFPSDRQDRIRILVNEFNIEGKGIMLGILDRAHQVGKLDQAIEICKRQFQKHWSFRPKNLRGSFIIEKDAWYIEEAYRQLGIPSPAQQG